MAGEPRYIQPVPVDPTGTVDSGTLPKQLPHGLTPRDYFRMVEDVHDLLHNLNSLLHERHYQRLEELLDPAGFSGLLSRTVAARLASATRMLAVNRYHNGYPDLIVRGEYPNDAVQHGSGGMEVKASRYPSAWQAHGPRAGWFTVVQFELDDRTDVAVRDLEPTRVRAVLVAELAMEDWSWQPARQGRIRSGTASVKASGVAKLRSGAVWVDPRYRDEHASLLGRARANAFRDTAEGLVVDVLQQHGPQRTATLVEILAPTTGLSVEAISSRVASASARLRRSGRIDRLPDGRWQAR